MHNMCIIIQKWAGWIRYAGERGEGCRFLKEGTRIFEQQVSGEAARVVRLSVSGRDIGIVGALGSGGNTPR